MLLPKSFYLRNDVTQIAKDLLGKKLVSKIGGHLTSGIIVETEAYRTPDDLACHASRHGRTKRTETMYMEGGCAYVYKCYGIHDLFNVVTGPKDSAHAVLIRGLEPIDGMDIMLSRRKSNKATPELTNGPGKFTRAMAITTEFDGVNINDKKSHLYILNTDYHVDEITHGPRVGMSQYTKNCGHWPWRFRIAGNKWTSKPNIVKYDW